MVPVCPAAVAAAGDGTVRLIPQEWLGAEALAAGVLLAILVGLVNLLVLALRGGGVRAEGEATRAGLALVQRSLEAGARAESEAVRAAVERAERALAGRAETVRMEDRAVLHELSTRLLREQLEARVLLETKLRELGDQQAARLADIQRSVNEKLTESIEKQMQGSFQRVIDQFAQVQKAMGDVQAVTAQIGDLKRIFTNVKSRGGWGETQLRSLLRDLLPEGGWEENRKLRADSDEAVEFVLVMPSKGYPRPLLALDAKFPAEDYDRLLLASEAGHLEDERAARRALEARFRAEACKIGSKYIVPPVTVDYAIMYLPTDGLYVEAARMPGLIEAMGREHRVLIMGPSLLPALIRTVQVGAMSLTIAENAAQIERMLGAVRTEFRRIDGVLATLEKQTGTVNRTVAATRVRTRAMDRTLRGIELMAGEQVDEVLQIEAVLGGDEGEE